MMSISSAVWRISLAVTVLLFIVGQSTVIGSINCNRRPYNSNSEKAPGDNGYKIKISGNPEKYVPGEVYTVSLQGWRTHYSVQKFTGFMLVVDGVASAYNIYNGPQSVGTFQLYGDVLTMHSDDCPNAVVQTSNSPKSEIQVLWTAPPAGSGCVRFRGMVQESRETWYMDDGELTKELCEEVQETFDLQPETILDCCACDEAKYEVTFEGLWSRQTHPKDFPANEWLTHFSDIIGASHSDDYRVWDYGGYASDGLRQVAEWGSTRTLESELKRQSDHIRTIIKARGLWYPNVNGKTFAVFRVDNRHHLMSLVSMLGPSPDWIVGVSAMELCLKNCTWLESKTLNLYPWDAGTDSGVTYMSANQATIPRQRITKITNSYPNNEQSPFYDPRGLPMKPLARLTISRQRVYEKSCSDIGLLDTDELHHSDEDADRPECAVSQWSEFTPCSVTCGKGLRMRSRTYMMPMKAEMMQCRRQLEEKEMCAASIPFCAGGNVDSFFGTEHYQFESFDESVCQMSSWSPWGTCSVTCGKGFITRTRTYMDRMGRKKCTEELMQKEMCTGATMECLGSDDVYENTDPACTVTQWTPWSVCSVTCGVGVQTRTRLYLVPTAHQDQCGVETMEKRQCNGGFGDCAIDQSEAQEVCMQPMNMGPCRGRFPRYYYDQERQSCIQFNYGGCRGNRNRFERYNDCTRLCEFSKGQMEADYPSAGSDDGFDLYPTGSYSNHSNGLDSQHNGRQTEGGHGGHGRGRQRGIQAHHLPGGLVAHNLQGGPRVDCVVSAWSETPCSTTCGRGKFERRRIIMVAPQNGGRACPRKLVRKKICRNPRCTEQINSGLQSGSLTLDSEYFSPLAAPSPNTYSSEGSNAVLPANAPTQDPDYQFELEYDGNPDSDCEMGDWSAWSPCTQSCGPEAIQQRARSVVSRPRGKGQPCGARLERRYCSLPPCPHPRG